MDYDAVCFAAVRFIERSIEQSRIWGKKSVVLGKDIWYIVRYPLREY